MQCNVLAQLHESHQGAVCTKQRPRLTVYWPGINNNIDNIVLACKQCQDLLRSHPREPITFKPKPNHPFQEVAGDFCSYTGQDYLIFIGCYSDCNWLDIIPMGHNTTSPRVIVVLKQSFCRTGVLDIFWSEQGPQFTAKSFQDFAKTWGFQHLTSSPTYPQNNGKIEATVKSMKKLIQLLWTGRFLDDDKITRALLQYRNTQSRKDDLSPAMKLFSKPIQDTLPAHRRAFSEQWQRSTVEAEKQALTTENKVEQYYNQHSHTLPDINIGSHVAIQHKDTKRWEIYGIVTDIGPNRRYYVKTQGGWVLVRNQRFLRQRVPVSVPGNKQQLTASSPKTGTINVSSQQRSSQQWKLTKKTYPRENFQL